MTALEYILQIKVHKDLIFTLAINDFKSRYIGTFAGFLWAIIQPLALVAVFYVVFAIGFRAKGPTDAPFILWFVCGLAPWFFFNETLSSIANSITANANIIKKTVFPSQILPISGILGGIFGHTFFIGIVLIMLAGFSGLPKPHYLLVIYYLISCCALLLGTGWLCASLQVFYRDVAQGLSVLLNLWFWATPIVWPQSIIPLKYHGVFAYNPMYYIVEGYRGILLYETPRWPGATETIIFWGITLSSVILGAYVFKQLKPDFSDAM